MTAGPAMPGRHRAKRMLKTLLLPDRRSPTVVRRGPGSGTVALLNPQHDLQRQWGLYEYELNRIYRGCIGFDGVVYDIGAGDGVTTLLYANLAWGGCVVAFEPDAAAVDLLRRNLSLNPRLAEVVHVVPEPFDAGTARSLPDPTFVK